jgi:acetyltransferase-like isoleucine patch superfamily enzyme
VPPRAFVLALRTIRAVDRLRLWRLAALHPGLEIHPDASSNLAVARYDLAPGARLRIGAGVVTERLAGALHFSLGPGAQVSVGDATWLRTELGPVHVVAFAGARIEIGPEGFLNGCHVSAKRSLRTGRRVWIGPGSRVFDADQHDLDAEHPERIAPVEIEDHVWIAADATVLRGVRIGAHSVIGARSVVTADVPPHALAFGAPARVRSTVGDRSRAR